MIRNYLVLFRTFCAGILVVFSYSTFAADDSPQRDIVNSLFKKYFESLEVVPGFAVHQPIYRENSVSFKDGPFRLETREFDSSYPSVVGNVRFQSGSWFVQPFIGGPTMSDERVVNGVYGGMTSKLTLDRSVYGGVLVGRDLVSVGLGRGGKFEYMNSVNNSFASSVSQQEVVFGVAGGFRVVGDELKLNIDGQRNVDDRVFVEPIAEIYGRYRAASHLEVSMGVQTGLVTQRSVRVGFFNAKTQDDVDVNFYTQLSYRF